ncbi:MAG: LytTR family DNA-binding domain-containing protein [Burkholderiaceae bacterium]|nr:LytTR family DNA-binding domain-containing protein [Burkholderiaceae bacterium]
MTLALIADDEPALARHLQQLLAEAWPALTFAPLARHGIEAAEAIAALRPDVAFLDIQMPGLTGLEVAQGIEGATRVVFVTAYDAYAVQAFEQQALDYLLKPVKPERLARTVGRLRQALAAPPAADEDARLAAALQRLLPGLAAASPSAAAGVAAAPRLRWIRASVGELTHQVAVDDVVFFRSDDKYTCVRTLRCEHWIRTPIVELLPQLDPAQFAQVHRSTLVNLGFVAGTRRDDDSRLFLRLRGLPDELPVSRAYVPLFRAM